MKRLFIFLVAVIVYSCNSGENKTASSESKEPAPAPAAAPLNTMGYAVDYSSSFEMGNQKNSEMILSLWKAWDSGDLSPAKAMFADTIHIYTMEGAVMAGGKDSVIAGGQAYRNSFTAVNSSVHTIVPLRSTDKNEDWVAIWGLENRTDKKGKKESIQLHEVWKINSDGKIAVMYQFGATPPKMK